MTKSQMQRKVPCEVYSRIVGYLRPVQNWNKGKQQEFIERLPYRVQTNFDCETADADQGTC